MLTKNVKSQYLTKHIDVQYHYIQKLMDKKNYKCYGSVAQAC